MASKNLDPILVALQQRGDVRGESRCCSNQCPTPDQHVVEQSDSWLAPELLEMLIATVRIGLDGREVVDLSVAWPELYEQGEPWWPLDHLREGILPQRRAGD